MQKTVLITGITGFLGSNLAVALIKKGYKIIALKRKLSSLARIENILDDLTLYDIEDLDFSIPFKNHGKINAVIHTATSYGRNGETPWQVFEANTGFPLRLLDAASIAGVGSFINTDTILDKYLNLYSLSKNQLLDWGRFYSMHNKIKFVNMRLEHFYGPEDDDSKFTTYVMKSCVENVEQIKLTAGEQKRDFIYIDDVVSAYLKVIEKIDHIDDLFNEFDLGSGNSISIREFVEAVHRITKSRTFLNFGATPYRVGEVMFSQANITPLKNLGWQCEYTLDQGLLKVIERFK